MYFTIISLWKRVCPLNETNLNPSPLENLLLKLAKWFRSKVFLKADKIFLSFDYYLPLKLKVALLLNKLESLQLI